jgi:DNA-binding Xre family transcriptional regulator
MTTATAIETTELHKGLATALVSVGKIEDGETSPVELEQLEALDEEQQCELSNWIDHVSAESFAVGEEGREPEYPDLPDCLCDLLAGETEEPERPKVETREEAVKRLESEMGQRLEALQDATDAHTAAAEEAKAAKKYMEAAQNRLNSTCVELNNALNGNWQPALPFPSEDSEEEQQAEEPSTSGKDPAITAAVSELDITPSQAQKLEDADIATVKELEEAMNADRLRKVKGIGAAAIDKISDAVVAWRNTNGYGSEE